MILELSMFLWLHAILDGLDCIQLKTCGILKTILLTTTFMFIIGGELWVNRESHVISVCLWGLR